jgi:hypothetical protein
MKAPFLSVLALVAVAFCGVAQAGPTSPLYLTCTVTLRCNKVITVVQGNAVINTFPEVYIVGPDVTEDPIAVSGDVRTVGICCGNVGGQYTLAGTPTGTYYALPAIMRNAIDSTSDGTHNYLVDSVYGIVYQTARDFTNPTALFGVGQYNMGITFDASNNSLWISGGYNSSMVSDYSLNGTLLSSFSTGHYLNAALALDPADHTLWLVNDQDGNLEQYSKAVVLLSTGPTVGYALGGEFNLEATPTPEPGTFLMLGSGILGLGSLLRRKINL